MGANPLQVREQVLLLPLEVGVSGAVHFGGSKTIVWHSSGWRGLSRTSTLFLPAQRLCGVCGLESGHFQFDCWLKKSVFVADFILAAGCAAVSTGDSRHPTVANSADFFKKRKKKSSKAIDALWEGGRR